jgi:SAM-dependent methyltransferase
MLQDQVRTSLFQQAIKELVSSKHTVIDVGAGSGILSFFSATAGAKKVHAIECTQIIKEAEVIAIRNNLHEKIDFFHGDANAFRMRSKADIIISEWIGYFVMEEYMYQAFQVVRDRYLRQGGKVIPSKVRMYLAPVEDADLYQFSGLGFWESPVYGYDFSFGKKRQLASPRSVLANITSAACIAEPWKILTVDCLKDKASIFHFEQSGEVNVERNANLHGFVGFFELDLSPSVILSTSPFSLRTHWQQVYFPIEQCYVQKDDRIRMTMITRPGKIGPSIQLKVSIFRGRKKIHQCEYCYNQSK